MTSLIQAGAVALALIVAGTSASAADSLSAKSMAPACQRVLDGPVEHSATQVEFGQAILCLGVVQAVLFLGDVLEPSKRFCTADVSPGEALPVVLKYVKDHPKLADYRLEIVAALAFKDHWPCPQ